MHESQKKLGAFFFETAGWERPHWYESNAGLLEEYGDAVMPREHEWDSRWWSPIINAEHLRMREAAGVIDLHGVRRSSTSRGPGALDDRAAHLRRAVRRGGRQGRSTRRCSTPSGGFRSDLTVMRLGDDHFRVVTGGAHGMADRKWFTDHLPDDGATTLTDRTDEVSTIGLWGPRARDILASLTDDDVSDDGLRLPHLPRDHSVARRRHGAGLPDLLRRRARLGALRRRWTHAAELWETLLEAGAAARRRAGRHRRLRHHRPDREGLPRLRLRARRRAHHRRGRHAAAQGEGGRLRRQGGLPRASATASPADGAVHADRRRPHLGVAA